MTRTPISIQFVFEILGAAIGFVLTVPLSLAMVSAQTEAVLPTWASLTVQLLVGAALWFAAAIARLRPGVALSISWAAAFVQLSTAQVPSIANIAIFAVLFAAAAWGSRRLVWIGGASAVLGGIIAGGYFGVLSSGSMIQDAFTTVRVFTVGGIFMITGVFGLLLCWGAGLLWRLVLQSRRNREAQVRAEAVAIAEQERVRIARDMHDVVAHSLAVVIAQADGARYAAATDPEAATTALATIAQTSRAALSDVRMLLTQLRHQQGEGPQPTLADLEQLFAQVRNAGMEPRVTIDPLPPGEPPASIQLAVYRILQEALTNAIRHGSGDVDVTISWMPHHVDLHVRNSTATESATPAVGGHGLIGMRERAQLVGGNLSTEQVHGEFHVRARLPIGGAA
ncbi:signal transduction histidine kinase [Microbacterium keratanolyticum]|uniref:histidine kinase n=1 Tax=Microbacterium keratanolyticum TaxID=67574 RepID=A0A9W6M7M6_9MICO|nr:histidine kinase [Microbacterium keratanolyticum]MBM7468246.1 signal transduction histidine kinase [Microbacterium keratanolyticum]GLK00321.1 hypothetical protein GCM10017596_00360 [Microbacterium keratanolyticum]